MDASGVDATAGKGEITGMKCREHFLGMIDGMVKRREMIIAPIV
jgi:hypothetical protein